MSEHISSRSMFGEMDPAEVRRALVREMNRVGAYRAEGEYSGGHDEGGLEDLVVYDKHGEIFELPGGYDSKLHQAVDDLLDTKFGSWALGCSVYGRVFVDLREKRAWTEGSVETMEYVTDSDPISMDL